LFETADRRSSNRFNRSSVWAIEGRHHQNGWKLGAGRSPVVISKKDIIQTLAQIRLRASAKFCAWESTRKPCLREEAVYVDGDAITVQTRSGRVLGHSVSRMLTGIQERSTDIMFFNHIS
jgi:hypothetical protein